MLRLLSTKFSLFTRYCGVINQAFIALQLTFDIVLHSVCVLFVER